jgi:hypothetical protein
VTQSEARAWEVMGPCRATSMSWPCRKCAGSGRWPTGDRDRDRSVGSDHAARAVPRAGRIEAAQVQNTRRRDPRALRPRAAGGGRLVDPEAGMIPLGHGGQVRERPRGSKVRSYVGRAYIPPTSSNGLYSGVNARRVGRGAGSGSPAGGACSPGAGRRGCCSDGVDTCNRISGALSIKDPTLTRGVSHQSDREGKTAEAALQSSGLRRQQAALSRASG